MSLFRPPGLTILVVCSANVCRSPAAQLLLQAQLAARGLRRRVRVLSAGTEVVSGGEPPDPRMVALAREVGLRLRHRSVPLSADLLRSSDVVYAMEPRHRLACIELMSDAPPLIELFDPSEQPVPDPYFGNRAGVRHCFEQLGRIAAARGMEWQQRLMGS